MKSNLEVQRKDGMKMGKIGVEGLEQTENDAILSTEDVGMVNHKPKSYADIGRTWGRTVGKKYF